MDKPLKIAIVLSTVAVLALCGVSLFLARPAYQAVRGSCTVGVIGSSASITVRGILANRTCRAAVRDHPNDYYLRSDPPVEPVVCEYQRDRRRYIVRDEGALKLVGNALCTNFRQAGSLPQQAAPTPTTTLSPKLISAETAQGIDSRNRPSPRASEFSANAPVYVTYVSQNVKQGQTISVRLLRDGQPQSVQGGETTVTQNYDTLNGYFRYTPSQRGEYTAQLYLDGEATPSATVKFVVR